MAACPRKLLWFILEPISCTGIDRFLLQMTTGVSDSYPDYVFCDSNVEEVFRLPGYPTTPRH